MKKKFKKTMISILATGIACAGVITLAGCGLFGGNSEETSDEVAVVETTFPEENVNILEELANNEALVDTKVKDGVITEYFTDGSFVEQKSITDAEAQSTTENTTGESSSTEDTTSQEETSQNIKVTVHTPTEKVIRDKEGIVKVSDININTDNQNLIFKDNKIVIQEINDTPEDVAETTQTESQSESQPEDTAEIQSEAQEETPAVIPTEEKIVDVVKVKEEDITYTVTEYDKSTYDKAFEERETFVEDAKDTDEKINEVINKEVTEVVEDIKKKEDEAKKQAEEEAQAQEIKETEVHKDDSGNTVVTGKDDEGNKVEIVTDKQGNTEVKKTDDTGKTTVVAPIVQPKQTEVAKTNQPKQTETPKQTEATKPTTTQSKPTQPKQTEAPKPTTTQPKPTQPKQTEAPKPTITAHQHNWQPVYKTVHHDAVTHQETYTVKEPYTYTEKEPYTYTVKEPYTYTDVENKVRIYNAFDTEGFYVDGKYYEPYATIYMADTWAEANAKVDELRGCKTDPSHPYYDAGCLGTQSYQVYVTKTGYEEVTKTGYKDVTKTGYKDVQKTRTVTDKAAYDEKVVDYYKCSCGQTKK